MKIEIIRMTGYRPTNTRCHKCDEFLYGIKAPELRSEIKVRTIAAELDTT